MSHCFSSGGVLCVSVDSHAPPFLLSSFSLAEVLGSRWMWLGPVLWSVPMAVTLCIPVFPGCRILCILMDVEVGIPFILVSFCILTLAT